MWPSMWIFDRGACFPYLHPSFFFLSLASFLHPLSDFRNFPTGSGKSEGSSSFFKNVLFLHKWNTRSQSRSGWQRAPEADSLTPPLPIWPPLLIMRPCPPMLAPPRSHRKPSLVTQWSVQPWRGPLLRSHGRLAQGLTKPCELYFLRSSSCPEAHDALTQHPENVRKFLFTCPNQKPRKVHSPLSAKELIFEVSVLSWRWEMIKCSISALLITLAENKSTHFVGSMSV